MPCGVDFLSLALGCSVLSDKCHEAGLVAQVLASASGMLRARVRLGDTGQASSCCLPAFLLAQGRFCISLEGGVCVLWEGLEDLGSIEHPGAQSKVRTVASPPHLRA